MGIIECLMFKEQMLYSDIGNGVLSTQGVALNGLVTSQNEVNRLDL